MQADTLVGGDGAVLVVDDTALPKKGELSVGVAAQYFGDLGKKANCQTLVSLTLARGEVPMPVGLRLFLPSVWTDDPARCAAAGVPQAARAPRSKSEIALAEIDRVTAAGVRFGCVLADAGYGSSAAFRHGLSARGLVWSVGVLRTQTVYPADVELHRPATPARGRPPTRLAPSQPREDVASMLARHTWRRVAWRRGSKGMLAARFAAVRARIADGPAFLGGRHLPGDEVWLVGELRRTGERKFYLSNQPPGTSLKQLAATIKARWVCEQGHQQLKQELGLGAFEGRSWTGLHRHALMACIALAYRQHLRLAAVAARGKKLGSTAPPPRPSLPELRRAITARLFGPKPHIATCPHCRSTWARSRPKVPKSC